MRLNELRCNAFRFDSGRILEYKCVGRLLRIPCVFVFELLLLQAKLLSLLSALILFQIDWA